jgi:peptide/nickel transport system ATP-binding protein/oligopeptide transport system ATP-binding protein
MDLRDEFGMAIIMITHNMGVIAETADRVLVMYAGRTVEQAKVDRLFDHPLHPYTRGLLSCVPTLDQDQDRLIAIPGNLPEPSRRPSGCRFSARCPHAVQACSDAIPPLELYERDHAAACFRVRDLP